MTRISGCLAGLGVALAVATVWADESVLVVHEGRNVESWSVSPEGGWSKAGIFADCAKPMCAACANGVVYIGTADGRIVRYTPEGRCLGHFASVGARCDDLVVSPDNVWLYVATAFGEKANRISRYRLSDGKGGVFITGNGLSTPRSIDFGPDGCLYACNRGGTIGVFDVSGVKPVRRADIDCGGTMGGMLMDGVQMHLPFVRTLRRVDFATGEVVRRKASFVNCFNSVKASGVVWHANYDGRVVRDDGRTLTQTVSVGAGVCDLFNLTAAVDGSAAKIAAAARTRLAGRTLDYPSLGESDGGFKRLLYNNSGTTYLKAGLASWPMIMDYDGDGDLDVVLHSGGIPTWRGTWFFENTGKKGDRSPLFKPARRLKDGGGDSAQILSDGRLAVTEQGRVAFDYRENGMKNAQAFRDLPSNVHSNGVRGNVWRFADLNGDGKEDLVVGIGDWKAYGWHDKWDAAGVWMNEPIHGLFYYIRNEMGDDGVEKWAKPEILRLANGQPIDVYGYAAPLFADWDGDGDLDLLTCDFIDNYTYFENIGTKSEPAFAAGRPILDKFLRPIKADLCMVTATVADWDGDGHPDFITCEEDARICIIRNTGRVAMGIPVFEEPYHLRQERAEVHFGILATPAVVDWDGDGDQDIITGNSAGYVAFIENLSGPKVAEPKWAEPRLLEADGAPIRVIAGPNGSIQGPCEEKWGYTCLSVEDWDGDGLPDVMLNSIRGEILWCRNIGTRTAPKLAPPEPVSAEWVGEQPAQAWGWRKPFGSKNILTQWRTTPYMIDLDEDGLMDIVMLDVEGYLCLWRRARKDGKLVVLPPERCLCDENGRPLLLAGHNTEAGPKSNYAGGSGRRKFCFTDWTGDGKKDLIANSRNVMLYEFVKKENGKWFYRNRGDLDDAPLAGHTTSPTACDFDGDGREELLVGAEDGFFYLLPRED